MSKKDIPGLPVQSHPDYQNLSPTLNYLLDRLAAMDQAPLEELCNPDSGSYLDTKEFDLYIRALQAYNVFFEDAEKIRIKHRTKAEKAKDKREEVKRDKYYQKEVDDYKKMVKKDAEVKKRLDKLTMLQRFGRDEDGNFVEDEYGNSVGNLDREELAAYWERAKKGKLKKVKVKKSKVKIEYYGGDWVDGEWVDEDEKSKKSTKTPKIVYKTADELRELGALPPIKTKVTGTVSDPFKDKGWS